MWITKKALDKRLEEERQGVLAEVNKRIVANNKRTVEGYLRCPEHPGNYAAVARHPGEFHVCYGHPIEAITSFAERQIDVREANCRHEAERQAVVKQERDG